MTGHQRVILIERFEISGEIMNECYTEPTDDGVAYHYMFVMFTTLSHDESRRGPEADHSVNRQSVSILILDQLDTRLDKALADREIIRMYHSILLYNESLI